MNGKSSSMHEKNKIKNKCSLANKPCRTSYPEDDLLTVGFLGGAQDNEIALKRLEKVRNAIHIFFSA